MKSFRANVPIEVRIFDQPVTTGLESSMRPPLFYFPCHVDPLCPLIFFFLVIGRVVDGEIMEDCLPRRNCHEMKYREFVRVEKLLQF